MSESRKPAILMIDDLVVDVFVSEEHILEAEATAYPVEKGADITDHIRLMPVVINVEGVISDTPIGVADAYDDDIIPSEQAQAKLERVYTNKATVTVATSIKTYDNMIMTSLTIPRDPETGDAMLFSASFQQILVVENKRVTVSVPRAARRRDDGHKPAPKGDGKRMAPVRADGVWYDDDIEGWRYGGQPQPDGTWKLYKGQPTDFRHDPTQWDSKALKTDAEYLKEWREHQVFLTGPDGTVQINEDQRDLLVANNPDLFPTFP